MQIDLHNFLQLVACIVEINFIDVSLFKKRIVEIKWGVATVCVWLLYDVNIFADLRVEHGHSTAEYIQIRQKCLRWFFSMV